MLQIHVVPVTEYQQNCSIVFDDESKSGIVLDPGGEAEKVAAEVERLDVRIESIWLTHGHLDHAGGAEALKKLLGVEIIGPHEADKMLLDNIELVAAGYGMAGMQNATPDRWLKEGETLSIGEHSFHVLHTPGHAPGHVIFVNQKEKLILMGDVLFQGSIGRTDLPGGNHQQLMDSIANKILPLGDEMKFVCGHSPPSTIGNERASNPFLVSMR
jgi:glyoxylase-like metal-dependent hydrolase (beta-lactamase superfamily II)